MENFHFIIINYQYIFWRGIQKWSILFLLGLSLACTSIEQTPVSHTPSPLDINNVEIMFWQNERVLWVGNIHGMARISRDNRTWEVFPELVCSSPVITYDPELIWCNGTLFDGSVWQMTEPITSGPFQSPNKTIWAGSERGLAKFDLTSRSWNYVLSDTSTAWDTPIIFNNPGPGIYLKMITQDEALWFYSYTGKYIGINRWTDHEPLNWPMFGDDSIMIPDFEANDGSVWARQYPPYQDKIARWDRHSWQYMTPFSKIGLPVFIQATDQTVWVATGADEVGQWDNGEWQIWSPFAMDANIIDILEASDETIWIISLQNSVGYWNGQGWQIWNENEITLPIEAEDKLVCLPTSPKKFLPDVKDEISKSAARHITLEKHLIDSSGDIWFTLSQQEGIARWTGSCWRYYTVRDGLTSNAVSGLTFSPDGMMWAGTHNAGVNYYDPDVDRWYPFP